MSGTFIGVNNARKRRLAHTGIVVHYAAGLELNPKIINLVTVVNERHSRIHDTVGTHTIRRGEDLLGGNVGEEGVSIGRLTLAAGPLVTLRHANRQIGSICRGVMQAVKTIVVQEAQVLFERRVMKLPVALRVLAIGTSGVQNRIPQLIDCNLIGVSREHLARPSHDRSAGDAPRIDVVIQSTAENFALRIPRLGCRGRLGWIDALEGCRIRTLNKDKAGTVLGQGIQLQALPLGRLLKIAFIDMLVREPRHGIVGPDDRHVTGTGGISLRDHHAGK